MLIYLAKMKLLRSIELKQKLNEFQAREKEI